MATDAAVGEVTPSIEAAHATAQRAASGDALALTHLLFHAFAPHFSDETTVTCGGDTLYVLTKFGRLGLKIVERPTEPR